MSKTIRSLLSAAASAALLVGCSAQPSMLGGMQGWMGQPIMAPYSGGLSGQFGSNLGSFGLAHGSLGSEMGGFNAEAISQPSLTASGSASLSDFNLGGESAAQWATAAIGGGSVGASHSKGPKPIRSFTSVNQPIMAAANTLPVVELQPIVQTYQVPQTQITQENIKQPITQPIYQPVLQRYVQRAQPILQPIVNRVVQPVIHRQLKPFLTSETVQGDALPQTVLAAQYRNFNNQPITGAAYAAAPMLNMAQPPAVPQVAASVSKA